MPPPNLTDATAITITSLPYSVTTDPENNTNELWYKYTALAGDTPAIGAHVYGVGGVYKPQIAVSEGPLASYVDHPDGFGYYATQKAILVPVTAATDYWFRVSGGSGSTYAAGQTFTLRVYNAPSESTPSGSIIVPDDSAGFPASVIDPATGEVLSYLTLPAGEFGDSLPTGEILVDDVQNANDLKLFDNTGTAITTLSGLASGTTRIRSNADDLFYTSNGTTLRTIDADGNIGGTTWTLAATPVALAPSRHNTIAYYASSGTGAAVRRFDLVGNVAMSDLVAGVASYFIDSDMFVLADGTILVHYFKTSGGVDHFLRRYNTDGSTAQTYNFGTTVINHLAWSDDDAYIWVWIQASGQGTFKEMALSDGTFRQNWTKYDFVTGVSEEPATATPVEFSHSFSCPFFLLRAGWATPAVTDPSEPCCPCDCPSPRGFGGSFSTAPIESHTGSILPPVISTDWTPQCTGGGDVPTAADPTDPESWVS